MNDYFPDSYDPTVVDASGNTSGLFDGFVSAAEAKIDSVLQPLQDAKSSSANVGGALFEAIYQFGRGKVDAARESAVNAFLRTGEGRKVQAAGIQQTISQYLPFIIVGVIGIFLLGFATRR